jgi:hypothetical protein
MDAQTITGVGRYGVTINTAKKSRCKDGANCELTVHKNVMASGGCIAGAALARVISKVFYRTCERWFPSKN